MKTNFQIFIETHRRTRLERHYKNDDVFAPLVEVENIVSKALNDEVRLSTNDDLTPSGRQRAATAAQEAATAAVAQWRKPRLAELDADIAAQRMALMPTAQPDPRRLDFMLSALLKHTPDEIAALYQHADETEQALMEAASASVGRIPVKTPGGPRLAPLLSPELIGETLMARAAKKDPGAVEKLNELVEIRALHVTAASHATKEIADAFARY